MRVHYIHANYRNTVTGLLCKNFKYRWGQIKNVIVITVLRKFPTIFFLVFDGGSSTFFTIIIPFCKKLSRFKYAWNPDKRKMQHYTTIITFYHSGKFFCRVYYSFFIDTFHTYLCIVVSAQDKRRPIRTHIFRKYHTIY